MRQQLPKVVVCIALLFTSAWESGAVEQHSRLRLVSPAGDHVPTMVSLPEEETQTFFPVYTSGAACLAISKDTELVVSDPSVPTACTTTFALFGVSDNQFQWKDSQGVAYCLKSAEEKDLSKPATFEKCPNEPTTGTRVVLQDGVIMSTAGGKDYCLQFNSAIRWAPCLRTNGAISSLQRFSLVPHEYEYKKYIRYVTRISGEIWALSFLGENGSPALGLQKLSTETDSRQLHRSMAYLDESGRVVVVANGNTAYCLSATNGELNLHSCDDAQNAKWSNSGGHLKNSETGLKIVADIAKRAVSLSLSGNDAWETQAQVCGMGSEDCSDNAAMFQPWACKCKCKDGFAGRRCDEIEPDGGLGALGGGGAGFKFNAGVAPAKAGHTDKSDQGERDSKENSTNRKKSQIWPSAGMGSTCILVPDGEHSLQASSIKVGDPVNPKDLCQDFEYDTESAAGLFSFQTDDGKTRCLLVAESDSDGEPAKVSPCPAASDIGGASITFTKEGRITCQPGKEIRCLQFGEVLTWEDCLSGVEDIPSRLQMFQTQRPTFVNEALVRVEQATGNLQGHALTNRGDDGIPSLWIQGEESKRNPNSEVWGESFWFDDNAGRMFTLFDGNRPLCLTQDTQVDGRVILSKCGSAPEVRWKVEGTEIMNAKADECLTASGSGNAVEELKVVQCDKGSNRQKWEIAHGVCQFTEKDCGKTSVGFVPYECRCKCSGTASGALCNLGHPINVSDEEHNPPTHEKTPLGEPEGSSVDTEAIEAKGCSDLKSEVTKLKKQLKLIKDGLGDTYDGIEHMAATIHGIIGGDYSIQNSKRRLTHVGIANERLHKRCVSNCLSNFTRGNSSSQNEVEDCISACMA